MLDPRESPKCARAQLEWLFPRYDILLWAKNGSRTLHEVLKRIAQIIPENQTGQRILIDDYSSDNTRKIGLAHGWRVIFNYGKGISAGANSGLIHVETDRFISIEQDLLLAKNWFRKIPPLLNNPNVDIASGIRLPDNPPYLRKLQEATFERYQKGGKWGSRTLDNTVYRTKAMRAIGGFPQVKDQEVGTELFKTLPWKTDFSVISTHLRKGIRQELDHYRWYGETMNSRQSLKHFVISPLRALEMALKTRSPPILFLYPLIRFNMLKGSLTWRS